LPVTLFPLVLFASGCDRAAPPFEQAAARLTVDAPTATPAVSTVTPGAAPVTADASAVETTAPPPTTDEDLATSIASAVTAAASTLHRDTVPHTVVDSFVLVNADGGTNYEAAVTLARKAVDRFYAGRFDKHPFPAVTVFVFTDEAAYTKFCAARSNGKCTTRFGKYSRASRTIVMHATKGAETLLHEVLHSIVQADFKRAPAWLDESVAELFEAPRLCGTEYITGVTNWRYDDAIAALDRPDEPAPTRLQALFSMDTVTFLTLDPARPEAGPQDPAKEGRHLGLARFFAQWMDRNAWLWPFYRGWRDHVADDKTGEKTFAAVVGKSWTDAEADFEHYVRKVPPGAKDGLCPP
jgi:hypothetical protein